MKMKLLVVLLGVALAQRPATSNEEVCPETATAKKPNKTWCKCNRGTYLKVQMTGKTKGYYCAFRKQSAGRCSLSIHHLTFRSCVCHRPYTKASVKGKTGKQKGKTGYYCKRSTKYRDCPQSAYCLFNPSKMTSTQYNKQVRACNSNQDTTFASVQKESSQYCVCGSNAWKKKNPGHQNFYLRYTYHKGKVGVKGKAKYTHGYVCMPKFTRTTKKCAANVSRTNPSKSYCQCEKGERRMSAMKKQGKSKRKIYWCQRVAPCDTTNADAVSSVYCSCPKNSGETLRYVRGPCQQKKTLYLPAKCNTGKYKGYRVGFCFDDNKRTKDTHFGKKRPTNARTKGRQTNRRGGKRFVAHKKTPTKGKKGAMHPRRLANVHKKKPTRGRKKPTRGHKKPAHKKGGKKKPTKGHKKPRKPKNRNKRAKEHQCCKRISCTNRQVGYYCYKRSNCATASITRPSRTFCHCPRGTHLKYTSRNRGYYCQKMTRCSSKSATPTATQCTCRSGYQKKHQSAKFGAGKFQKAGWICAKKAKNCPSYNHSKPNAGSKSYTCGCPKGKTVHYYRDHNVFYKSCVTPRKKKATPHRSPRV